MSARRPSVFTVACIVIALILGAYSFVLPFGDDQGLYFYVAREWLHGSIPYRDVFDHKPPGIYVVYLASIVAFGENTWGIRAVDLAGVLSLGAIAARLVIPRGETFPRGLVGAACLVAAIVHYGLFDYWATAQTELWYTILGLVAITAAARLRSVRTGAILAGALAGGAVLLKPPAAPYVLLAWLWIVARGAAERRAMATTISFALAAAAPIALTVAYFASHAALEPMIDIVVRANRHYARAFPNASSFGDVLGEYLHIAGDLAVLGAMSVVITVAGLVIARRRSDVRMRDRYLLGCLLFVAGFSAVTLQGKFFNVHWLTLVGPMTYVLVAFADDARRHLERRTTLQRSRLAPLLLVALGYAAYPGPWGPLGRELRVVVPYLAGRISREEYASHFRSRAMMYSQRDIEEASALINGRAQPGDTLCVRGFSPQIYALTGLRYGGRLFWTNFVMRPGSYRQGDYLAEDRIAFLASRPRFVVTLKHEAGRGNVESAETYYPLGYQLVLDLATIQVLQWR